MRRSLLSWSLGTPEIFWATASLQPARTPEVMALVRSGWASSCLMYACPAIATTSDISSSRGEAMEKQVNWRREAKQDEEQMKKERWVMELLKRKRGGCCESVRS